MPKLVRNKSLSAFFRGSGFIDCKKGIIFFTALVFFYVPKHAKLIGIIVSVLFEWVLSL